MNEIIQQLIQNIPSAALPVVVVVLGLYYMYKKIGNERELTKKERDKDSQDIHDDILNMKFQIATLNGIVDLHKNRLESIDQQLNLVNQELVKLNVQVDHLVKALETQNRIIERQQEMQYGK